MNVTVEQFESDTAEAVGIATAIGAQIAAGAKPEDFAVLARTNAITENIADTLEAHRIPVRRRVRPNLPEDWKRAKAAVRMLQAKNNDSILRFVRLVNATAAKEAERLWSLGKVNLREQFMTGLECTAGGMARDLTRLKISRESIERVERIADGLPEGTMADIVLAISQSWDAEEIGSGVFCSTVHQAKGKEWETVIIAGCEEGTFPSRRAAEDEERRVMFVAVTRGKTRVIFTWAKARRENFGRREYKETERSRFVSEALPS